MPTKHCRSFAQRLETWAVLESYETSIALLVAAKELIKDQEREIAALKKRAELNGWEYWSEGEKPQNS